MSMLHIDAFVRVTGFEFPNESICRDSLKTLWETFHHSIPVLVDEPMVRAFGYKGELREQKRGILKLAVKYNIPIAYLDNDEYEKFLCNLSASQNNEEKNDEKSIDIRGFYPDVDRGHGKGKTRHILMMPRSLKKLMLVVDTAKGDALREYMISFEELIQLYSEYQLVRDANIISQMEMRFDRLDANHKETMKKLDELQESFEVQEEVLTEVNDKLTLATEQRAVKGSDISKLEQFILIKLNDPNFEWEYYAIRTQAGITKRTLKKKRIEYPHMKVLLSITYQPNSKNLYNLIRTKLYKENEVIDMHGNKININDVYHLVLK